MRSSTSGEAVIDGAPFHSTHGGLTWRGRLLSHRSVRRDPAASLLDTLQASTPPPPLLPRPHASLATPRRRSIRLLRHALGSLTRCFGLVLEPQVQLRILVYLFSTRTPSISLHVDSVANLMLNYCSLDANYSFPIRLYKHATNQPLCCCSCIDEAALAGRFLCSRDGVDGCGC
jgi:hypothetical protein